MIVSRYVLVEQESVGSLKSLLYVRGRHASFPALVRLTIIEGKGKTVALPCHVFLLIRPLNN
jgi:hypothetical protein